MLQPATAHLAQLQELTRQYARFSASAGGLSAVIGGGLCLLSYLAGALLPATPALRLLLMCMPVLWLASKQWLVHNYYQRLGHVEEQISAVERSVRMVLLGLVVVVSVIVVVGLVSSVWPFTEQTWTVGLVGRVVVVLLLPVIAWRWLRNPLDLVVGTFLVCQAALAMEGRAYALWGSAVVFPAAAVLMIAGGIRDHWKFRLIEQQIRRLARA